VASEGDEAPSDGFPAPPAPGKLVGRGHGVGDFLEAHEWDVLESRPGRLRVLAHLPPHVKNLRGQLFGGFTPTYVDFVALHTFWAGREWRPGEPWLATLNMRVDYFAPIVGERFEIRSRIVHRGGSICSIETRFLPAGPLGADSPGPRSGSPEGEGPVDEGPQAGPRLLAHAYTTLKAV